MTDRVHPPAYLITFTTYGTRLHGSEQGSYDRGGAGRSARRQPANPGLERYERGLLDQPAFGFDRKQAEVALQAIRVTAEHRGWDLLAASVGLTHVHAVVKAEHDPKQVIRDMKSYASRALNRAGYDGPERKRWTRNGYRQYLWKRADVLHAIEYVLNRQGKPLASYRNPNALDLPTRPLPDLQT
jgi:REP element-mobilizing transposase RayT